MIHYRFAYQPVQYTSHQYIFDRKFSDDWLKNEPVFLDLISDVDHSDYLGGLLFKNRRNGQCYNFTRLAGGSKMVMVSVMYPQFEFPITHMGANCLPYLAQLQDTHDAHFYGTWNIMYSAECGGFSCPSLYLDDYDVVVDDYTELQKYLNDWLDKNPKPAHMGV